MGLMREGEAIFLVVLADVIREIDDWPEGKLTSQSFLSRLQLLLAESEIVDIPDLPDASLDSQTLYDELCLAVERLRQLRS